MASYLTNIYQSSNTARGTQGIAHGWDYTAGSGDLIGQANDISTSVVYALIAIDTDGTLYVMNGNDAKKLFAFYPTGAQTANVLNIDRTHSFPLGSRQGSTYGFGFDQPNDRFLVPNANRVNVYDRAVSGAHRSYQRFDLLQLGGQTDVGPNTFLVKGNRAFLFGWTTPLDTFSFNTVKVYEWPSLRFIERRTSLAFTPPITGRGVLIDGKAFFAAEQDYQRSSLNGVSLSTFQQDGSVITLSGISFRVRIEFLYVDGDILYAKSESNRQVLAFSAAGTGNKNNIASMTINLSSTLHTQYRFMFADPDYFYFGRPGNPSGLSFDAYSKTTRLRDTDGDWSLPTFSVPNNMGATTIDDVVYLMTSNWGQNAYVKAV